MNCSQVKQNIPQWLDGELAAGEAAVIASHVENCPDCGHEAAFWQEVNSALKADFCAVKAPPELTGAVMAQLNSRPRSGLNSILLGWKRNLAVAAAFLLIAAGSVSAYMHSGGSGGQQLVVDPNQKPHMQVVTPNEEPTVKPNVDPQVNPTNGADQPNVTPAQPGPENKPDHKTDSGKDNTPQVDVKTNQPASNAPAQVKAPPVNGNNSPPAVQTQQPPATGQPGAVSQPQGTDQGDDYVLLSTGQDRFAENTLIRVKVTNMDAAYKQAMTIINGSGAQYEVLNTETIPCSSQETLKVTVDSSRSGSLKGAFSNLGQVITTSTQKEDLNSKYNDKVEQYRSLEEQLQTAGSADEKNQLQIEMTAIKEQLKAWDKAGNTDTIVLWLQN